MNFLIKIEKNKEKSNDFLFLLVESEKNSREEWYGKIIKSCLSLEEARMQAELLNLNNVNDIIDDSSLCNEIYLGTINTEIHNVMKRIFKSIRIPFDKWNLDCTNDCL